MEAPVKRTHRLAPYLFICLSLTVVGVLYDESLIAYSLMLVSVAIFMRYYASLSAAAVSKLTVVARSNSATEASDVLVEYELRNNTKIPVLLGEYSLSYSPLLKISGTPRAGVLLIPPSSSTKLVFAFGGRVGTYRVGPLKVSVRDPLGLFRSEDVEVSRELKVKILPAIEPVVVRKLWVSTRKSGLVKTKIPGEGVELYDVREYRPGDELRYVVWRLFASRGMLAVKEMERESFQYVVFLVDSSRDMWVGPPRQTPVEHFSRIVASVSYYLCRRGYNISAIVFNEKKVSSSGKPASGLEGLRRVFSTLADLEYEEDSASAVDLGEVISRVVSLVPRERAIVFLFTRPSGSWRGEFVVRLSETLKSKNHVFFLVVPLIVGYETTGLPPWARGLYQLKLYEVLKEDLESVARLRAQGVKTVAVDPTYAPLRVVRIVEELI
ncbi:MAG: DUF58 domain-containing protein [Sulfolobales archaeon]